MFRWRKELEKTQTGEILYYDLLRRGFIKTEDQEPPITGHEFYLDAFRELETCRPSGLSLQAIPFTAMVEYFRIYGTGDFDEFAYVIRTMDNVYLELIAATKKAGENAGTNADAKNNNKR